jgi:vacuolar iron transporter family protein
MRRQPNPSKPGPVSSRYLCPPLDMTDEPDTYPGARPESARDYDLAWVEAHITEEQETISLLGEIREMVFGAQDGLVSTLAVVATVAGATNERLSVLVAGLAAALAGVFSMAIGEYMSSKSQDEIFQWQIEDEREEVLTRPAEAEAEVAFLFMEEGMTEDDAWQASSLIARNPDSLLATMVTRELGIFVDDPSGSPFRGALFMGGAFALGSAFPIVPFLFLSGTAALILAIAATAVALFAVGAIKSRWTHRSWVTSGLEIVLLAAVAGGAGFAFGTVLPGILGFAVPL